MVKKKSLWCRQLRQQVRKLSHLKLNLVFPSPYLPISLSIFPSLQISFSLFSLFLSSLSLFLNPKNTRAQTHKMTKGASPSPRTRMRATAASRHVARNLLRQARRNDESLLLSQSFQFSVFSSTLHIFKYRNKVVDRSEKLIYDDSMRWPRAATGKTPILSSSSEQAPMRLRMQGAVGVCSVEALFALISSSACTRL